MSALSAGLRRLANTSKMPTPRSDIDKAVASVWREMVPVLIDTANALDAKDAELTALRAQAATDRAEIERLTRERDAAMYTRRCVAVLRDAAEAQVAALSAQVETMTAALIQMVWHVGRDADKAAVVPEDARWLTSLDEAVALAVAALSAESGAEPQEPCRTCGGTRKVVDVGGDQFQGWHTSKPCPDCQGGE